PQRRVRQEVRGSVFPRRRKARGHRASPNTDRDGHFDGEGGPVRAGSALASMGSGQMSEFELRVRAVVAALRPGEVATYGEVAEEAGYAGAARAVGTVLAVSEGLPWWRVVAANGR